MNKEVSLLDQRLQLHMNQSQSLAEELAKRESTDKYQNMFYFGLGVIVTGLAVYSATKLTD
jgi:hypothetical protein